MCTLIVQFTTIPLSSKLFKLLVKDLENAMEATQAGNHDNGDGDSNASSGVSLCVTVNVICSISTVCSLVQSLPLRSCYYI